MDEVILLDEDNNKKVIKQGDMYLYQMDINVGDKETTFIQHTNNGFHIFNRNFLSFGNAFN